MQYTTQQLQGGPKYSHKTRIGNWNEDHELDQIQKSNYNVKKGAENLPFSKTLTKYQQSYKQVPWTHSADGMVRWGDSVMVQNAQSEGWLVMDVGDKVPNVEESYNITSTSRGQNPGPMTRSIFQLCKVDDVDMFGSDEFIRFGQKVRILSNSYLTRKQLSLTSHKQTATVCSPLSNKQLACMSAAKQDYNGVWVIDHIDPNFRFEMQGEIVKSGDPILIRHVQTCVFLGSDENSKYKNDFGSENEVFCYNHSTLNKSQNLYMENVGRLSSDVPSKFQEDRNVFFIQHASDASYGRAIEDLSKFDINDLIKDIKAKLMTRSAFGIRGLARIFKAMDENGNKKLDVDDFRWGLMDYGVNVTKEESTEILNHFDKNGDGCVNFDEFLVCLRGDLNQTRTDAIRKAYDKLDVTKDGRVTLDDIARLYTVASQPEVASGARAEHEVYMEFMSLWDTQVKDGCVTFPEFCDYYRDISASVDSDAEFCAIIDSAWKLNA